MSDAAALADAPPIPGLRYESVAGRGGMSIVYKAWCEAEGRYVAVKVMDPAFNSSAKDVRQFVIEAKAMNTVSHPNIVHAEPADFANGKYYFVMDFVGGYTLGELVARKKFIPEQDALVVAEAVGEGLRFAWNTQSMVHCDLKPENIMVDTDGTIKITDLGIAHVAGIADAAQTDEVIGTPAYISPEQVLGDVELDQRSDIYSLGATLYHLVCGQPPFPGLSNDDTMRAHVDAAREAPDPREIQPILSEGFVILLAKAMAKNRKNRYKSWTEFLNDVQLVYSSEIPSILPGLASSVAIRPAGGSGVPPLEGRDAPAASEPAPDVQLERMSPAAAAAKFATTTQFASSFLAGPVGERAEEQGEAASSRLQQGESPHPSTPAAGKLPTGKPKLPTGKLKPPTGRVRKFKIKKLPKTQKLPTLLPE